MSSALKIDYDLLSKPQKLLCPHHIQPSKILLNIPACGLWRLHQFQVVPHIYYSMATMFLFRLITLVSLLNIASANCRDDNCIEGSCIEGNCQCSPGFLGDDCSIPFTICEDGERSCFNGSECERNNERDSVTGKYKYHCDCSKAFGLSSFAGQQCEFSATATCQHDVAVSEYTFCTNGGMCVETVSEGQEHQGCDCTAEFEGLHCQYLTGDAPPEELAAVQALQAERSRANDLSGVALTFIIIIPLAVVALFAFMVWKRKSAGKENLGDVTFEVHSEGELKAQEEAAKKSADGADEEADNSKDEIEII